MSRGGLISLKHLLYEVSPNELYNVAARLAQETQNNVDVYCPEKGQWSFEVIERFLFDRGMKCTVASSNNAWKLDSPTFLKKNPGMVGFMIKETLESFRAFETTWTTAHAPIELTEMSRKLKENDSVVIHKMWMPLQPFFVENIPFHIMTDNEPYVRHECQPSSCWNPQKTQYTNHRSAVKKYMCAHKRSHIMMSNNKEIVLCQPSETGWQTKTILNYEVAPMEEIAQQAAETLVEKVVQRIEQHPETNGWTVLAHAMFCANQYLGGSIRINEFSSLTEKELQVLKDYEGGMNQSK
jgi:hypothetical protein